MANIAEMLRTDTEKPVSVPIYRKYPTKVFGRWGWEQPS